MDETAKTIPEMLREYNALALGAANLGLAYRERRCFKDRNDAVRSLDAVNSSLRAAKQAQQRQPEEAAPVEPDSLAAPAADNAAAAANTEEAAVAKKEKTKRTPRAKAANGNGAKRRTRIDITIEALRKGVTVDELAAAYKDELGNGKVSTARLALSKVPKAQGREIKKKKVEDRGTVYSWV